MNIIELLTHTSLSKITKPIVKAVTDTVFDPANEALQAERIGICRSNKCATFEVSPQGNEVCSLKNGGCGCFLDLKTGLKNEKCPKGYW